MRHVYPMSRILLFMILFFSVCTLHSQTLIIGAGSQTGTSSNSATGDPGPIYRSTNTSDFVYSRYHYLYTSAELSAAGLTASNLITSLAWNKDNNGATNSPAIFRIWIKNSSKTVVGAGGQLWTDLISGSTLVYDNSSVSIPATTGYQEFTFGTPFLYTGGAIEISLNFDISSGSSPWTTAGFSWTKDPITDRTLSYVGNTAPGTTLPNLRTVRPQLRIAYTPAGPCTAPPSPGNATASVNSVCPGALVTLGLTGQSTGSGQTYTWQSSASFAGPYTDISSASTSTAFAINPTVTAWYRAKVACSGQDSASVPVQVLVNTLFPPGTYSINNTIPTGGGNFQSFTDAVNAIRCGIAGPVVFRVAAGSGPYNEQISIPQIGGASATNTITFKGNLATLAFNSSATDARAGITLDGADHIKIDSLIIDGTAGTYGWGVLMTNRADSNRVSNCVINVSNSNATSVSHAPVVISGSTSSATTSGNNGNYDTIANNTLNGGYYGIVLYGSSTAGAQNLGNVARKNNVTGVYSYGIYVAYQSGALVSGNDVSRPNRTNSTTCGGVFATTGNLDLLIEKNKVHNMFDAVTTPTSICYGIYISSVGTAAQPNRIINNLIYNIGGNGTLYGIYNTASPYMLAYHNTVSLDGQFASTAACYGFYQTSAAAGIDFRNNLIYVSRAGTGVKRCLYFVTTTSTITSNRNVLYMNAAGGTDNKLGQYGTTSYTTLTDWKGANGSAYDQQSISVDPLYVNPGAADYTPSDPSINGLGANLGITTDILDNPRSSSPDPGAFEFTISGTDGALTWVSPAAGPSTTGLKTITVNLSNSQTVPITSANLSYTDGTNVVTQNFSGLNITSGNSQQLSFTTQYNLVSSVNMRVYINTINGAVDNNQANDTTNLRTFCVKLAGNYTINNTLPTGGTNFMSFTEAAEQLNCAGVAGPVVFTVAAGSGPYNEQVVINAVQGASAINTVTFKGNLATLSFNSANTNLRAGITLDGADHIKIDSLIIDGTAGTYGWGVFMTNQADSNKISNCIINVSTTNTTSVNHAPIVISGSYTSATTAGNNGNSDSIINNTLSGGYYSIVLYGNSAAGSPNLNNYVRKNTITGMYSYSVYVVYQSKTIISGNDISRPSRTSSTTTAGAFISTGCLDVLVEKNRIHNMFDGMSANASVCYGLYSSSTAATVAQPIRFINNLVYNVGGNGTIYGIYNTASSNVLSYHNTISIDGQSASTGAAYGLYQTGTATGVDFRNNIAVISRSGTGTKRTIYFVTTGSTIISNRNILIMNAAGGTNNNLGQYGTTNYATLADWQGANTNAYDQQSLELDPVFQNPAGGNYEPTSSIVDNLGTPLGVLTDIRDSTRSTTNPDAGAYEFSTLTAGINMSAEALITPAISANGCYGPAETITIRIRNSSFSTIDFSVNPVTVTTNVSGAITQTLTASLTSGTLASDATMNVPMSTTLNMTTPGVYMFNANTSLAGDVNTANDAMIPANRTKNLLTAGTASTTVDNYCVPSPVNPVLSVAGHTGYGSLQWKQSVTSNGAYTNIAGANTAPYTLTAPLAQTMYYKLVATCGTSVDSSAPVMISYTNPMVVSTTPGGRCGTGTVTLGATGSPGATLNWYANASGGASLGTGTSFTTPSISSNTNYYVSASDGGTTTYVGKTAIESNASGTGGGVTSYLTFTAISTFTLHSVVLYPYSASPGAGTVTIELRTSTGTMLQSKTVNANSASTPATSTPQLAIVDFVVPGGADYRLGVAGYTGSITNMFRDDANLSYPYTLPGVVSITGTNLAQTYYYYFYNWQVITGCEGSRTAVLARTDDCPVPVTLVSFTGEKQGSINKLQWTTTTEVNNAGFELERSADGKNFSKLTFVSSKAENGNSNLTLDYVYYDERPLAGNGYYRLKQVDKDGKASYSNVVLLKGDKVKEVMITSIYPNPAEREINLVISSPTSEKITLVITDITGKVLSQSPLQVSAGDNLHKLQVGKLASGTYFVKTLCSNGCESVVQKFVKQ